MIKKSKQTKDIKRLPLEVRAEMALKEAVADAVAMHKRMGHPIAVWKNGRAVWIPPEEIVLQEAKQANLKVRTTDIHTTVKSRSPGLQARLGTENKHIINLRG